MFERIIAGRIVRHLCREGLDFQLEQYGFCEGRSIIDAIRQVRALVVAGRVVVVVSLDIVNAFNPGIGSDSLS